MAPTGPRDLFASSSESNKTKSPAETVAPDATIGSTTPFQAFLIALNLEAAKCNSSLYLAINNKP